MYMSCFRGLLTVQSQAGAKLGPEPRENRLLEAVLDYPPRAAAVGRVTVAVGFHRAALYPPAQSAYSTKGTFGTGRTHRYLFQFHVGQPASLAERTPVTHSRPLHHSPR